MSEPDEPDKSRITRGSCYLHYYSIYDCPPPMPTCLAILLLLLFVQNSWSQESEASPSPCGGHLNARRGVISSPNFPGPFTVPIHCRWIIDASELADQANASIIVYLTQLFAYRSLSFHEYAYYESETTSFGGALIHDTDEGNVFDKRWLRTYRPYMVVEFQLDRLEGNHVRVLDKLLDVYGFNFTYEMSVQEEERPGFCSLKDCSFAGNCLLAADYATFYCDCFEGFGGEHCGHGPLCVSERGTPICQNGGTCRHVGAAAVRCLCAPHFKGDFCEFSSVNSWETDCRETDCIFQCPFPGEQQLPPQLHYHAGQQQQFEQRRRPCYCKNPIRVRSDRTRFECRIKLTNVTYPKTIDFVNQNTSLEIHLSKQLSKYILDSQHVSSMEDLKILSVTPALEVNFHFFGHSRDGDKIRNALNKLVQRKRLGEFFLEPSHFTFQQKPALRLQKLRINQVSERQVQLGDQFVLSCVAVGSSDLKFYWYKDDSPVNMSKATRSIWYRHLPNDDSDYHTSILTVEKATLLDAGVFTCQIVDWSLQQCKNIRVTVKDDPNVKIVPLSSTVERGSTVRLMCTTPSMRDIGIGFGWTKNRALLRFKLGEEVWEDLYPAGSLLTISQIQKSAVYTCNVAHRSSSVRVEVVNRTLVPICSSERAWNVTWPDAAPGTKSLLPCPQGFSGNHVSRQCSMRNSNNSEWGIADFSDCLYKPLVIPYDEFRSLTFGYERTNGSSTIQTFWDVLLYRRSSFYPGEGDRVISLLEEVEHYQYNLDELHDLRNSAEALMRIIDKILSNEHSILSQQKLVLLSQLVHRNLGYWSQDNVEYSKHLSLAEVVVDVLPMKLYSSSTIMYSLRLPLDNQNKYPDWYNERITIRIYHNRLHSRLPNTNNKTISGIVVVYRNLARFFPDTYVTELEDGTDLEYRISSRVISVTTSYGAGNRDDQYAIELKFGGARNHTEAWNASCGSLRSDGGWNLDSCILDERIDYKDDALHCLCSNPGTFAAFLTARAEAIPHKSKNSKTDLIVIIGCASCLLQCFIAIIVLSAFWLRNRSWLNFLKIQCCSAIVAAMATFIYAVHYQISEDNLSIVAMCLEAFLLIGTASPISQALIIYVELSNIHTSQQLQPTLVAVITGVPILALLTTELMRKTVGWKHESWWLIFGTEVYNIFVVCSIAMLLTFLLLYTAVIYKTKPLLYGFTKKDVIQLRIRTLHRSAVVIFGIVAMEVSSIFYANSSVVIYHYLFAFQSALLGLITLSMYVISGEVLVVAPVLHKLKRQSETDDECASEQTKVRSRDREPDREISSSSSAACALPATVLLTGVCESVAVYPEARGVAVGIDAREYVNEAAAGAYAAATKTSLPEIQIHHVDDIHLDNYGLSPRTRVQLTPQPPQILHTLPRRFDVPRVPMQHHTQFEQPNYLLRGTNFAALEPYTTLEHSQTPYKELMSLTALQPALELQHRQQQQQHVLRSGPTGSPDCPTTILCNAQVETCLGRVPTMPDVTLAINGENELLKKPAIKHIVVATTATSTASVGTETESSGVLETMPDIANTMERKQPDGEDVLLKLTRRHEIAEEVDPSLTTNGMLESISHDLDYLLNRTKEDA